MSNFNPSQPTPGAVNPTDAGQTNLKLEVDTSATARNGDAAQFRAALERHLAPGNATEAPVKGPSLGAKVSGRITDMAGEIKEDQQRVSKMLEQASRTGDPMQLMKAMMALSDYQVRVQTISKTVSKATQSFEQLTKLQ